MKVCGLKSVLAVTILGLTAACGDSDYNVALEPARVVEGVTPGSQAVGGAGEEAPVIPQIQPKLNKPDLIVQVNTENSTSTSVATETATENSAVTEELAGETEGGVRAGEQQLTEGETNSESAKSAQNNTASEDIDHSPHVETPHNRVTITVDNWEQLELRQRLESLLSRATLNCNLDAERSAYCQSTALAVSLSLEEDGTIIPKDCTAQYIGNSTVVTASHCVPLDVLNGESSCADRMAFGFYQEGQRQLIPAGCVALREQFSVFGETGEQDLKKADVAFLEIQFAEGQGQVVEENALTLSRAGFQPEDRFYFVSITPFASRARGGDIELKECGAFENTVILDEHTDYRSEAVVLLGERCKAPPGNSGAVVISGRTGMVVGSVHAYMDDASRRYQEAGFRLTDEGVFDPVIATNFACLPSEVVDQTDPMSGCENIDRVISQKRRNSWQQITTEYDNAVQSSTQEAQALFDTSAIVIGDVLDVTPTRQNQSSVVSPLRASSDTLVPVFKCHRQSVESLTFSFEAAQREAYQYLDKTLRIRAAKKVQPVAQNYSLKSSGGPFLRLTESSSGQPTDLPRCY